MSQSVFLPARSSTWDSGPIGGRQSDSTQGWAASAAPSDDRFRHALPNAFRAPGKIVWRWEWQSTSAFSWWHWRSEWHSARRATAGRRSRPSTCSCHAQARRDGASVDHIVPALHRHRVVALHLPRLHMTQNGRQVVLPAQPPVRILPAGGRHRQRAVPPRQKLLPKIRIGLLQRPDPGYTHLLHQPVLRRVETPFLPPALPASRAHWCPTAPVRRTGIVIDGLGSAQSEVTHGTA